MIGVRVQKYLGLDKRETESSEPCKSINLGSVGTPASLLFPNLESYILINKGKAVKMARVGDNLVISIIFFRFSSDSFFFNFL